MQITKEDQRFSGKRIVLGISGGIAAYKAAEIVRRLVKEGGEVQVIMTRSATKFIGPLTLRTLSGQPVLGDSLFQAEQDPLNHLWVTQGKGEQLPADLFIIAPATANLLGKYAQGIANDFLSTALLAAPCSVLVAPAMNSSMFYNKAVQENLKILVARGVTLIGPETGTLASCDEKDGPGRMTEPEEIIEVAARLVARTNAFTKKSITITAGPTRERWDAIRYISNDSSGKMGYSLATEAERQGAQVTLISGPTGLSAPPNVKIVRVESANDMHKAVMESLDQTDVLIMAAAVADYRPKNIQADKIKKSGGETSIILERTQDILEEASRRTSKPLLVGFAAESENLIENAKGKLRRKNLDLIIANPVGGTEGAMGSDSTSAVLVNRNGQQLMVDHLDKNALAVIILNKVQELLGDISDNVKELRGRAS